MAAAFFAPIRSCTMQETEGNPRKSPVAVAIMTRSMSSGAIPDFAMTLVQASTARSEVATDGSAIWRKAIPVCDRIHSSEVSRKAENSSLDILRLGTAKSTALITACMAVILM